VLIDSGNQLDVTGDAAINVTPDRVRLFFGVESRHKELLMAKAENDAAVRKVIASLRALNVAPSDIQTDYLQVNMSYVSGNGTIVDCYTVTKTCRFCSGTWVSSRRFSARRCWPAPTTLAICLAQRLPRRATHSFPPYSRDGMWCGAAPPVP
jgi:hypothetical protein